MSRYVGLPQRCVRDVDRGICSPIAPHVVSLLNVCMVKIAPQLHTSWRQKAAPRQVLHVLNRSVPLEVRSVTRGIGPELDVVGLTELPLVSDAPLSESSRSPRCWWLPTSRPPRQTLQAASTSRCWGCCCAAHEKPHPYPFHMLLADHALLVTRLREMDFRDVRLPDYRGRRYPWTRW